MNIRAITLDIGGTLIEPWPSVGHVYAEVAARFGVKDIEPDELTENFMLAWKSQTDFDYSHESWFALVRAAFGDKAGHLPAEYFSAVYDRFAEADTWRIYDDVFPALKALTQRGLPLGVISNWDERLRLLLVRLGLDSCFSHLVISCEVGATKPHPQIFLQAAAALAVAPGELLHVGDSYRADVRGAEGIGAVGRQVMRGDGTLKVWQIRSLREIDLLVAQTS